MKFNEKWLLFLVATFVTSFGITDTLLKKTQASTEIPANPAFNDINFYKCVVDAYNLKNNASVEYTISLTDEQLATITDLSCVQEEIVSLSGVEKLTSLTSLDVNNKSNLDVNNDMSTFDITNIILSEGTIDFDPEITEYTVTVSDFDTLEVTVEGSSYTLDKNIIGEEKSIVITVIDENENIKTYTIYVEENSLAIDGENDLDKKNDYVPIFIGIICVLVLINIFRIVKVKKK